MSYYDKSTKDRQLQLFASDVGKVIGTYTLNGTYLSTTNSPDQGFKWLREGTVLAYDSSTGMVYPKTATGNTVGILHQRVVVPIQVDTPPYHPAVDVILAGWVREAVCTDNGTFGSVTADTKSDLSGRVFFVSGDRL